jgi:hypothetical protein
MVFLQFQPVMAAAAFIPMYRAAVLAAAAF